MISNISDTNMSKKKLCICYFSGIKICKLNINNCFKLSVIIVGGGQKNIIQEKHFK